MRTSYKQLILATLGAVAVLALSGAVSGAAAASGLQASASVYAVPTPGGNGQGGDGQGGNGQGGNGQGTRTPELPSGVLFGIGLVPLGAGLYLVWRRRSKLPA
jgi:hypothetical protein